jgi:diacylglycerol kinase (ATP)
VRFLRRLASRFQDAFRGFLLATRQPNLRIMLAISAGVVALAAIYNVTATSWAIVLVCIGVVVGAEVINTAIETLADRVEPGSDPAIRDTKDIAAAAVLILSVVAAATGIVVLWPYIID